MADELDFVWKTVCENATESNVLGFFRALEVWIEKPHVVNRRLSGSIVLSQRLVPYEEGLSFTKLVQNYSRLLLQEHTENTSRDLRNEIIRLSLDPTDSADGINGNEHSFVLILRKLLPRRLEVTPPLLELIVVDRQKREASFLPLGIEGNINVDTVKIEADHKPYQIQYHCDATSARILLQISNGTTSEPPDHQNSQQRDGVFCPTVHWLQDQLLPKLSKWAEESQSGERKSKGSLRLVPLDKYTLLYQQMKQKYGERLVKIWPERTDPKKYVFEDIAIAAYLLLIWEEERTVKKIHDKQSFVDLGCGNGLLVYILNQEGHPGTGIDVRRRKIWDLYGPSTKLEERPLDPTLAGLFPGIDWLIGNHSDELTPWIPVMAARSSFNTRYFVLPCCLFDFNSKFIRENNKLTQYHGYLKFVHDVGETCGFEVEEDSLRIPSTKRICHVGRQRTHGMDEQSTVQQMIKDMILRRGCDIEAGKLPQTLCPDGLKAKKSIPSVDELMQDCSNMAGEGSSHEQKDAQTSENPSSLSFTPRPAKQEMRNCMSLDRTLQNRIVLTVTKALLGLTESQTEKDATSFDGNEHSIQRDLLTSVGKPVSEWNKGGSLSLPDVVKLFDKETLLQLKNECGGMQTLLRNHFYIFNVQGGAVQLRDWTHGVPVPRRKYGDQARREKRAQALWKTSLCWFHFNHPQGCPVMTEKCSFAHSTDELQERPSPACLKNL